MKASTCLRHFKVHLSCLPPAKVFQFQFPAICNVALCAVLCPFLTFLYTLQSFFCWFSFHICLLRSLCGCSYGCNSFLRQSWAAGFFVGCLWGSLSISLLQILPFGKDCIKIKLCTVVAATTSATALCAFSPRASLFGPSLCYSLLFSVFIILFIFGGWHKYCEIK